MDIRLIFSTLRRSRGAAATSSGFTNEKVFRTQLQQLAYNGTPLVVSDVAGSNKTAHDVSILSPILVTFETKTLNASEGGGCTLRLRDGVFQLPENAILRSYLPTEFRPWEGRVPSCLRGDTSLETWEAEKDSFKGIYLPADPSAIAQYYRAKGTHYIQVERRGLFHTGDDVHGWGVPVFEPTCRVRIRLKQHHSGSVPQDVQACFNYASHTLPPSPYDLMDPARLPPGFALAVEG